MKNILLPTDLTVQSLWPIHRIVEAEAGDNINIHLVHMLSLPTGISDLLSMRSEKPYAALTPAFTEAYQLLCNRYSDRINCLKFRFVYGNTVRYLNNFMDAQQIDSVYTLTNYRYEQPLPHSVDCSTLLSGCRVPLHRIVLADRAFPEYSILSALLSGNEEEPAAEKTFSKTPFARFS